jgi:glyoxylase-like metal-dependent hydrolase (beta-lactamase superfamily II)
MSSDLHEVYAIRYGTHERRASDNYIGGDPHNGPEPIDYYVWAIVGAGGTVIVDTGFDDAVARRRNRQVGPTVGDGLKAMGIAGDAVRDVIVTHLHYDHSGNTALFPNARFHLQDDEMAYATGRCMCHAHQRAPFECDYVVDMVRKVYEAASSFTMVTMNWRRASRCTRSAAIRRACNACG